MANDKTEKLHAITAASTLIQPLNWRDLVLFCIRLARCPRRWWSIVLAWAWWCKRLPGKYRPRLLGCPNSTVLFWHCRSFPRDKCFPRAPHCLSSTGLAGACCCTLPLRNYLSPARTLLCRIGLGRGLGIFRRTRIQSIQARISRSAGWFLPITGSHVWHFWIACVVLTPTASVRYIYHAFAFLSPVSLKEKSVFPYADEGLTYLIAQCWQ